MAYELTHTHQGSLLKRIANFVKAINERDALKDQIKKERLELSQLDDIQLRDIGVSRDQALRESTRGYHDIPAKRLRFWICCK